MNRGKIKVICEQEDFILSGYKLTVEQISALNQFFAFQGWADCRVKYLRI